VLEHYGTELGNDIGCIKDVVERHGEKDIDNLHHNHPTYKTYKSETREQYLAVCFLQGGADCAKYGNLVMDLENDYTKGTNHIPSTLTGAYFLLDHIKVPQRNQQDRSGNPNRQSNKAGDKSANNDIYGMVFVNKHGKQVGKEVT
jgi:hypothetical protein